MISAKVIADSLNAFGNRITTLLVVMPRYILAEFNTHRMLSRNSASSRAIPFKRLIQSVIDNPFIPMAWQKEHTGMQGFEYYTTETCSQAWIDIDRCFGYDQFKDKLAVDYLREKWIQDSLDAVASVSQWGSLKITKQMVNRQLEPFMYHTVIMTATEWENFFALRCPRYTINTYSIYDEIENTEIFRSKKQMFKEYETDNFYVHENDTPHRFKRGAWTNDFNDIDWFHLNKGQADIHMMATAEAILDARNESTPKQLKAGEWHIPFGDGIDTFENSEELAALMLPGLKDKDSNVENLLNNIKVKIATARCARVSYTVVGEEKEITLTQLVKIHDEKLLPSGHMSPFEHCARAMSLDEFNSNVLGHAQYDNQDGIEIWDVTNSSKGWSGNFRGFIQYRKMLPGEAVYTGS